MNVWPFFKRDGILVFPSGVIAWLLIAATFAYSIYQFRVIDSTSHSASDTLMNYFLHLLIDLAILYIVALVTSEKVKV